MAVINPPEKKLAKCTSVQWVDIISEDTFFNLIHVLSWDMYVLLHFRSMHVYLFIQIINISWKRSCIKTRTLSNPSVLVQQAIWPFSFSAKFHANFAYLEVSKEFFHHKFTRYLRKTKNSVVVFEIRLNKNLMIEWDVYLVFGGPVGSFQFSDSKSHFDRFWHIINRRFFLEYLTMLKLSV